MILWTGKKSIRKGVRMLFCYIKRHNQKLYEIDLLRNEMFKTGLIFPPRVQSLVNNST